MSKVDFMCVGAPKSGTTWLYQILDQHPEIFIPRVKEVHYFNALHPETYLPNQNFLNGIDWYHSFFKDCDEGKLKADFSTSYLVDPKMADKLYQYNDKLRIVAILRNPVYRAWSHFRFLQSRGMLKSDDFFTEANRNKSILNAGRYADPIESFQRKFPTDQIRIIFYEELSNPEILINDLTRFLKISDFEPQGLFEKANQTKAVKNNVLHQVVTCAKHSVVGKAMKKLRIDGLLNHFYTINSLEKQSDKIPEEIELYLRKFYREDVSKLSDLLGRKVWDL